MSKTFSAKEPALGYYYQIIRGLVLLLDEYRMESPSLSFECLDDVSIENEEETDLYQLKLHVSTAQLTDRSADFWKTIRVWSEGIADGTYIPERTIFTLITTASRSADTFINKFESNDKKDIMATIERVTDPFSNSMNEHRSRIKAIFVQKLGKELAVNYCIDGERGEPKSIALPREFVVWEGL